MLSKSSSTAPSLAWVNYDLTAKDKAKLSELMAVDGHLDEALSRLVSDGYKIQLVYDGWAKCVAAYVFPGLSTPSNQGMALSARARTATGALWGVVFRHFEVFKGQWRVPEQRVAIDDL